MMPSMIAAAGDELGGLGVLLLGLLILALGVLWIIFPVLVLSKFNELLKVQRAIHAALQSANTAQAEIAKALQWMVDNWRKDTCTFTKSAHGRIDAASI